MATVPKRPVRIDHQAVYEVARVLKLSCKRCGAEPAKYAIQRLNQRQGRFSFICTHCRN